jgi:hypothetical protein
VLKVLGLSPVLCRKNRNALKGRAEKLLIPQQDAKTLEFLENRGKQQLEQASERVKPGKTIVTCYTDHAYRDLEWTAAECVREFIQNLMDEVRTMATERLGLAAEEKPLMFAEMLRIDTAGGCVPGAGK